MRIQTVVLRMDGGDRVLQIEQVLTSTEGTIVFVRDGATPDPEREPRMQMRAVEIDRGAVDGADFFAELAGKATRAVLKAVSREVPALAEAAASPDAERIFGIANHAAVIALADGFLGAGAVLTQRIRAYEQQGGPEKPPAPPPTVVPEPQGGPQ